MRRSDAVSLFLGLAWLGSLVVARTAAWRYEFEPGDRTPAASAWPEETGLSPPEGRPRLILFLRENCPCSPAGIQELDRLLSETRDGRNAPRCSVVFVDPVRNGDRPLRDRVGEVPGVEIRLDPDGAEAVRFRVRTSGEVVVYDASGVLTFQGGLTVSRGHEGESIGRAALRDWFLGRGVPGGSAARPPVFGCGLNPNVAD